MVQRTGGLLWSFRDGPQDQTSDAQLRIGESRDSGFDAAHRPGMTVFLACKSWPFCLTAGPFLLETACSRAGFRPALRFATRGLPRAFEADLSAPGIFLVHRRARFLKLKPIKRTR